MHPDIDIIWPGRTWHESIALYLANEDTIHERMVMREYHNQCYWVWERIGQLRPHWTHLEQRALAERIVMRRLERSQVQDMV